MSYTISCYTLFDITPTGVVNRSRPVVDEELIPWLHKRNTQCNFDTVLQGFQPEFEVTPEKTEIFRKIVKLKDIIAEWVWYLLTASVVISTSYTMMMNAECTKTADEYVLSHNIAMAETTEETPVTTYTVTD